MIPSLSFKVTNGGMPMVQLIASDLDDTLLRDDLTISLENKQAVQAVMAQNVVFTIATGRMFAAAAPYGSELGLPKDQPIICYNGALIKRLSGETIYEAPLSVELGTRIVQFGQERGWTVNAYYNDQLYVAEMNNEVESYLKLAQVPAHEVGDLVSFVRDGERKLSKVLMIGTPEQTPGRIEEIRQEFGSAAQIVRSKAIYIEITRPDANKGRALRWLAESMGLTMEEVMAIGDSNNDVSMLKMAGIGVAVANGVDSAKQAAKYLTTSNNEHGVAEAIQDFVLRPHAASL